MCVRFALHTPRSRNAARDFDLQLPVWRCARQVHGHVRGSDHIGPCDARFPSTSRTGGLAPTVRRKTRQRRSTSALRRQRSARIRSVFADRRCLIPADGWYEWRKTEPVKQPCYITLKDPDPDEVMRFASLWEPAEKGR